jgi:hypothetical protein
MELSISSDAAQLIAREGGRLFLWQQHVGKAWPMEPAGDRAARLPAANSDRRLAASV